MFNGNFNGFPDGLYNFPYGYRPVPRYPVSSPFIALGIVLFVGLIFSFFFLRKKNEKKYRGLVGKLYHFLSINRFYAEDLIRVINVLSLLALITVGIFFIDMGKAAYGIALIVIGGILLRICLELIMMFIILCRKSVSIDKRLSNIENFYGDVPNDWPAPEEGDDASNDEAGDLDSESELDSQCTGDFPSCMDAQADYCIDEEISPNISAEPEAEVQAE